MKDITKFKDYAGEDRVVDSFEMRDILQDKPVLPTYKTIPALDKHIEGFMPSEIITVSGPTGGGKTLFCQTLTYQLQKDGCIPLWLQFENTPEEFHRRFSTLGLPFFVQPLKLKQNSVSWVEDKICEAIVKFSARCIFVDHLHYLFDIYKSRNSSLEIGQIIRSLKLMAVEYNIFIILMAHMTKIPDGKEPAMGYLRDSGMIAAESDTVLIVWRDPEIENGGIIKPTKARRSGKIDMPSRRRLVKVRKIDNVFREVDETREENLRIQNYQSVNPF